MTRVNNAKRCRHRYCEEEERGQGGCSGSRADAPACSGSKQHVHRETIERSEINSGELLTQGTIGPRKI
jgi:hypothetical protein